jgi:hypothetical protein
MAQKHLILALLLLGAGTACRNSSGDSKVEPMAAIAGLEPSSPAASRSRSRLNTAVLSAPEASREAALAQLRAHDPNDPDARLAALYVLSLTLRDEDADALAPVLTSREAKERVLAAAAMLALGDRRAVPVLIELLGVEDPLPFGDPPLRVWQQARMALLSFSGQDLGLRRAATASQAAAAAPALRDWWAQAGVSFEVARTRGRFG